MFVFFPVRAQIKLHKWPVLTLAISVLCLAIYYAQVRNLEQIGRVAENYCGYNLSVAEREAWRGLDASTSEVCSQMLRFIHTYPQPEPLFNDLETQLKKKLHDPAEATRLSSELRDSYRRFAMQAPSYLTGRLWMERPSWNPWRMITSSFAHGSWGHVIFNVIFFFAFAATVELLLGPVLFLFTVFAMSLFIGTVDTLAHLGQEVSMSLGLSGVVTGMLALFIYFIPRAKIRFFFWFLLSFGFIGVPGWFVGLWYIGGDILRNLSQVASQTNYIAHLAGAASGFLLGVSIFRAKRHWAQELVEEKVDLSQDESRWSKINAFFAAPVILYFVFMVYVFVAGTLLYFVTTFWIQLLLLLPVGAALWQLYRMKHAKRPDHERFQDAMARLARGENQRAVRELEALAARGYARAMLQLGVLFETGRGVLKDLTKAVNWYTQAAKRNNPDAQYQMGLMHAEGRGLRKDPQMTRDWWKRAVQGGHAHAAMSLGYDCEKTAGTREQREQAKDEAAKWYYQAGRLFLRRGQLDDARMAAKSLRGLRAEHPLAVQLETEIGAYAGRTVKPVTDG